LDAEGLIKETERIERASKNKDAASGIIFMTDDALGVLFRWCQVICQTFGLTLNNFTTSFSDGRALCYLISYYLPELLPMQGVKKVTTATVNTSASPQKEPASPEREKVSVSPSYFLTNTYLFLRIMREGYSPSVPRIHPC